MEAQIRALVQQLKHPKRRRMAVTKLYDLCKDSEAAMESALDCNVHQLLGDPAPGTLACGLYLGAVHCTRRNRYWT